MNHNQFLAACKRQAEHYWNTVKPRAVQEMKAEGYWEQHLNTLLELTWDLYNDLIEQGTPEHMALVQAKEEYLFPPSEEEIARYENPDEM